jgi:uncharacterized protein
MNKITAGLILLLTTMALNGCKLIVNKMAFHPDTTNTIGSNLLPPNVKEVFIETKDKVKIQSYLIHHANSDRLLIYFHGNAGNISGRLPELLKISSFGINVLGVSYHGYGKSEGKPSEQNIYLDGDAALSYATKALKFPIDRITILGRSIGTTVAINSAQHLDLDGLILVTPLTSGKDHAKAMGLGAIAFLAADAFNNVAKLPNILCPTLVIHGTRDQVIPFPMGKQIYKMITTEKQFVQIDNADHNNLSSQFEDLYWPPIRKFINR